jgi:hypothetical protein
MGLVIQGAVSCTGAGGVYTITGLGAGGSGNYSYELTKSDGTPVDDGGLTKANLPASMPPQPNGTYRLFVYDADDPTITGTRSFTFTCSPPLILDFATATAATATTGGTVSVQASGGLAPLQITLVELNIHVQATSGVAISVPNVPAGTYTVRVIDGGLPPQRVDGSVTVAPYQTAAVQGCTDPTADNYDPKATVDNGSCTYTPPVRDPYFEVPVMQSLRFVVPGSNIRPAFDNVLLADEHPLDYTNPGYCQLVEQADTLVLQCLSNYQGAPMLELRRKSDNGVVRTVPASKVQQGAGITASFEAYFKADTTSGRTRVYFNEEALPLPFRPGQRITISATGTSLDGTYPIRDVLEDAAAAVPFLVLQQTFPGTIRLDGSVTTTYTVQQFDTYQFVVPFAGIAESCYYARIYAVDPAFGTGIAISEPIEVAVKHRNTVVVTYRNFDNAFGLNYSAGLVNRIRAVGRFFERKAATEKTVLREDDSTLDLLSASAYRNVDLEVLLEPGWRHEQLAIAFCHDFVKVNTERVTLAGEYSHEPVQRFTQARGTATLELRNFLGAGNRDDFGDVDGGGPYLSVNASRLKIRVN